MLGSNVGRRQAEQAKWPTPDPGPEGKIQSLSTGRTPLAEPEQVRWHAAQSGNLSRAGR